MLGWLCLVHSLLFLVFTFVSCDKNMLVIVEELICLDFRLRNLIRPLSIFLGFRFMVD